MYDLSPQLIPLLRRIPLRRGWALLLLVAALPVLNLAVFTWLTADTMVSRDQWHFIPMLHDYFGGDFHLFSLWVSHSQHRTPGYKLLFLLNAVFFKLDMRLEVMLGFATLVASVLLLLKRFLDGLPATVPGAVVTLGVVTLTLMGFNLNQWYCLTYPLTSLAGYGGILCFVWLWLMLDTQLREGSGAWKTVGLCLALAFSLISFAAGMGPALIVTLLAIPLAVMLLEWRADAASLRLLVALAVTAAVCEWLYWYTPGVVRESPHSRPFLQVLLADPLSLLEFLVLSFASSVIPADAMDKHYHIIGHDLNLVMGVVVMGVYALSAFLYLRLRMWKASYIPAFLMAFTTLFILSTLVVRLPSTGLGTSEAPRYVLYSQIGFLGCLWVLFQWFAVLTASPGTWWAKVAGPASSSLVMAVLFGVGLVALWRFYPYVVHSNNQAVQQVLTGSFSQPDWLCPDPDLCVEGRMTLEQYGLNVFADQPAPPASHP